MKRSVTTIALAAVFALAAAGDAQEATAKHGNNHEPLKKAGVLIPINNPQRLDNGYLQFDVYADQVNKFSYAWSKLWGKDFGYYLEGTSRDKNRLCPYFKKQDMTYFQRETIKDMSHYKVTIGLPEQMNDLTVAECALSPDPGDKMAPNLDTNKSEPDARGPGSSPPSHRP